MEAADSVEKLENLCQTARRQITEYSIHIHRRENIHYNI